MKVEATPFRWPGSWTDPGSVDLLKGTAVDLILVPAGAAYERVRQRARELGMATAAEPPAGVKLVEGAWPGVKPMRGDEASSGPTGVAWVDSNGWLVRLTRALDPGATVWVEAPPKDRRRFTPASYELAVADAAAHGGRWVMALDEGLAARVTAESAEWRRMMAAARFFASRAAWAEYTAATVVGVVSDFTGPNEFRGQELLNLLARAGQNCRILPQGRGEVAGLRAVIYADGEAPAPALRKQLLGFAEAGGLLIATAAWGEVPGRAEPAEHPRFEMRALGKGRIAIAKEADDPWVLANDSVVLVSHRHDLVRCFNSGSFASYFTQTPDRKRAVVHLLFYADEGPSEASVRVAGSFREARISSVAQPEPRTVPAQFARDAVEVHLPPVPPYVALELSV